MMNEYFTSALVCLLLLFFYFSFFRFRGIFSFLRRKKIRLGNNDGLSHFRQLRRKTLKEERQQRHGYFFWVTIDCCGDWGTTRTYFIYVMCVPVHPTN